MNIKIPKPISGGLILSYQCSAECRHCMYACLVNNDFAGLLSLAKNLGYVENQDGYLSKCHLCVDIRKYLVSKDQFKELAPKEFYRHLE